METKFKAAIEEFVKKTDRANLANFVSSNMDFVIQNSPRGVPLQQFWEDTFKAALSDLGVRSKGRESYVDWGYVALNAMELDTEVLASESTVKGVKRGSKTASCSLTTVEKEELVDFVEKLSPGDKWLLSRDDGSQAFVEDEIVKYTENCDYEHCSHSLILNVDDPVWEPFFSECEMQEISTKGVASLPSLPSTIDNILNSCRTIVENITSNHQLKDQDKKIVDNLTSYLEKLAPFDPYEQFDEYWTVSTLKEISHLYRWNIPSRMANGPSELDFVVRIWSQLDKCFDNHVDTKRDNSCLANLVRLNNERRVDGTKPVAEQVKSSRPDLLWTKDNVEFGVGEYVFTRAVSKAGNDLEFARNFQVVGFSHTCFRMILDIMDCPAGVVCRLRESEEYEIPQHASLFCTGIIPIIKLTLMAKASKRASSKPELKYQVLSKRKTINIPASFTFTPNKKVKSSPSPSKTSSSEGVSSDSSTSKASSNDTE
ncbi:hypothetical protein BDC45DRAFT_569042 [Circinella umbellata]|nr:hypothetical protein BDC45DRAFT_569042 [Circinella umbellata]